MPEPLVPLPPPMQPQRICLGTELQEHIVKNEQSCVPGESLTQSHSQPDGGVSAAPQDPAVNNDRLLTARLLNYFLFIRRVAVGLCLV
jgi:hypothetical protein